MSVLSWLKGYFTSPYIDAAQEYRILSKLSSGAFGATMLILRESKGDLFAGKRSLYDPVLSGIDMKSELKRALQVEHPNVAAAHKYYFEHDSDGITILAEFHQGPTFTNLIQEHLYLFDELRNEKLKVQEVAWIGQKAALGLQAIHSAGMVHGDISPNNIILGQEGPVIIDFGLAEQAASLVTGTVMGTPGFIAPELGFRKPTARSDVFALGAVLYYLYFQETILDAYGRGIGLELTFRRPRNPSEAALIEVLRRAIAIDPRERYPSAARLAKALAPLAKTCPRNWLGRIEAMLYQHDGMACEKCENALPEYASYCPGCGHGEYDPTNAPWIADESHQLRAYPCFNCNAMNATFWNYCYACGEQL